MKELESRLTKELQQSFNVKIMDIQSWILPVHSIEITYETVTRTKMDILMKMMLVAFQKAEIETIEELSEILLVEQLFIQDLSNKMKRAQMIEISGGIIALTDAGLQQLESGIFEHEPESGSEKMLYSPCHQSFLYGELTNVPDKKLAEYRYSADSSDWDASSLEEVKLINGLKNRGVENSEGNVQVVVSKIESVIDVNIDLVACIEFRLYNKEEDIMYARVWNTLTEQWDVTLETQLNEKERKQWRELYL